MSELHLTPAQHAAVYTRGEALLVAAGAGSGKTRVLVERLMAYVTDPESPRDIDSFLIITFTKAAAAELRGRIAQRLTELCAAAPGDRRLRRQSALCARAQIGTIHSFCVNILREHAHVLGLPPDFRVADEARTARIRAGVLDRVLERAYGRIGRDPGFQALVDTVGAGRDDSRLQAVVLELYEKMSSHAYPDQWAARCAADMAVGAVSDAGETVWGRWLLADAARLATAWARRMDGLVELLYGPDGEAKIARAYGPSLADTAAALRDLARAAEEGWDALRACLPVPFPRLGVARAPQNPALAERVKATREACKAAMKGLAARFATPSARLLADLEAVRPAAEALLTLTLDFARAFAGEKRRQALVDFSDLEHLAVELLIHRETGAPTPAAREISRRFTEIMVDEYQDVNAVQDAIFTAVSREGRNLFLVGDVKQSIYRFRLADPTIFLRRYEAFGRGEGGRRILLRHNFRARSQVLDGVNHVFGAIMSRQLGELDYDENARLLAGAEFPPAEGPLVTLTVCEPAAGDEDAPDAVETEAAEVAARIRRMVDEGLPVDGEAGFRPVRWGDIVILLRAPGSLGGVYRRALEALDIPVHAEQGTDFFAAPEVTVMMNLLALVDNPRQDVPLIAVLSSALFGFTADELAGIRARASVAPFCEALRAAAETEAKCRVFLETLDALRQAAAEQPLGAFLWHVYTVTDALALACALPGGAARRENLLRLFDLARSFEETGYRGLGRFVSWLRQLQERGTEPVAAAQGGDAVRIMSIHKSKGLEFPVVFLCGCARRFNKTDTYGPVPVHTELGLGMKRTDLERGVEYPTLSRLAVARKLLLEGLSEEMRVLYVAMTRAKTCLHITCALRHADKTLEKLRAGLDMPLEPCLLENAASPALWLLQAALLPGSPIRVELSCGGDPAPAPVPGPEAAAAPPRCGDSVPLQDLAPVLDYVYPHAAAVALPAKLTATELKSRAFESVEDAEAEKLVPRRPDVFRLPALGEVRPLTGAEKGTATHLVMQHIDLAHTSSQAEIDRELARLTAAGRLTPEQAAVVDTAAVVAFFRSETGALLRGAEKCMRERRFSVLVPAADYFPGGEGESVLLQGVVDCCVETPEGLVIVDFKTDRVAVAAVPSRAALYTPQLRAYAQAMERVTGQQVCRCLLYFLEPGVTVELPCPGCGPAGPEKTGS